MQSFENTKHFLNTQKINTIRYFNSRQFFCPVGQSMCTYQFTVEVTPRLVIPDYLELDKYFNQLAKNMTIEDATLEVFEIFRITMNPLALKVTCLCEDAKHSKVEVIKEL